MPLWIEPTFNSRRFESWDWRSFLPLYVRGLFRIVVWLFLMTLYFITWQSLSGNYLIALLFIIWHFGIFDDLFYYILLLFICVHWILLFSTISIDRRIIFVSYSIISFSVGNFGRVRAENSRPLSNDARSWCVRQRRAAEHRREHQKLYETRQDPLSWVDLPPYRSSVDRSTSSGLLPILSSRFLLCAFYILLHKSLHFPHNINFRKLRGFTAWLYRIFHMT